MSRHLATDRNTILGLSAILLWSATVALARSTSERIGPLTAGASVYLTASVFLVSHLYVQERSLTTLRRLARRWYLFIAFIEQAEVIKKILTHLGLWPAPAHTPPVAALAA